MKETRDQISCDIPSNEGYQWMTIGIDRFQLSTSAFGCTCVCICVHSLILLSNVIPIKLSFTKYKIDVFFPPPLVSCLCFIYAAYCCRTVCHVCFLLFFNLTTASFVPVYEMITHLMVIVFGVTYKLCKEECVYFCPTLQFHCYCVPAGVKSSIQ